MNLNEWIIIFYSVPYDQGQNSVYETLNFCITFNNIYVLIVSSKSGLNKL